MDAHILLEHVEKSPQAVAIHDKDAWLEIFASDCCVEDPVGSSPHHGEGSKEAISRFYETFIAANTIEFEVAHDIVNEMHVVRDLNVHTSMSPSLSAVVPMHLLYELKHVDGELKIHRLAAHWELLPMLSQVFSKGLPCIPVLSRLSVRMMRMQGTAGILGFSKAVFSVGKTGKKIVDAFFEDLNQKHMDKVLSYLDAVEHIQFDEKRITKNTLHDWVFDHFETGKMIAAGNFITVSFLVSIEGDTKSGVVFFEFDKRGKEIISLRFYC